MRSIPARLRFGLLCGLLAVLGVAFSALPTVWSAQQRELSLERAGLVRAATAAAHAVEVPDASRGAALEGLVSRAGFSGAALIDAGGALLAGDPSLVEAVDGCQAPIGQAQALADLEAPPRRLACARLPEAPGTILVVAIPAETRDRAAATRRSLLLALALGALAGALILQVIRWLLEPLEQVSDAARRLAAGERGVRVRDLPTPELQPIAAAVDQLADAVEAREDAILGRLELTRQLAGLVAHEVRNPLQSLTLLVEELATLDDPIERQSLLEAIQRELQLIEEVARRLLATGASLQLAPRPTRLDQILSRCAQLLALEARARGVSLALDAAPFERAVDAPLLRRAAENLIRNAVAMTPPGGSVQVSASPEPDGGWSLHVDDDGPGVPVGERERIFERGVSARAGGAGLGLPLARLVAEAHGGSIRCETSPAGGARFVLSLGPPEAS